MNNGTVRQAGPPKCGPNFWILFVIALLLIGILVAASITAARVSESPSTPTPTPTPSPSPPPPMVLADNVSEDDRIDNTRHHPNRHTLDDVVGESICDDVTDPCASATANPGYPCVIKALPETTPCKTACFTRDARCSADGLCLSGIENCAGRCSSVEYNPLVGAEECTPFPGMMATDMACVANTCVYVMANPIFPDCDALVHSNDNGDLSTCFTSFHVASSNTCFYHPACSPLRIDVNAVLDTQLMEMVETDILYTADEVGMDNAEMLIEEQIYLTWAFGALASRYGMKTVSDVRLYDEVNANAQEDHSKQSIYAQYSQEDLDHLIENARNDARASHDKRNL